MSGEPVNGGTAGDRGPVEGSVSQRVNRDVEDIDGRLVENILHFVRALRKAGVKAGPAQVETAIRAVAAVGFTKREDFYHTLRATLVTKASDQEVFHQAFSMFWRDPDFLEQMLHMLSPSVRSDATPPKAKAADRRASEALGQAPDRPAPERQPSEVERDMRFSMSERETIRAMDFEQMSADELAEAARAIKGLRLPVPRLPARRARAVTSGGRADARATVRAALRRGGEIHRIARKAPATKAPDLVALCDISGSMSVYSRMILRFLHTLAHAPETGWGRAYAFTFGTTLTNVSRALSRADPDVALAQIGHEARDWEGGTRIGPALERFNKDWSRRVLARGGVVLLITDGLERGAPDILSAQVERLSLSARRLVWLNPLLRWDGFVPQARGVRAILPWVDSFHACHSLDRLEDLTDALGRPGLRDKMLALMDRSERLGGATGAGP